MHFIMNRHAYDSPRWLVPAAILTFTLASLCGAAAVKDENETKGGLVDGDFKPKPAYRALDKLINKDWKTQTRVRTDAQGQTKFRGFYGMYDYTARIGGKIVKGTFRLQRDAKNQITIQQ